MPRGQEPNAKQVIANLRSLFRGVVKQYDPGALLAGELQDAQNARLVNGNLINRGGQSKVNGTDPVTGSPVAIFDDWYGFVELPVTYGALLYLARWASPYTEPPYTNVLVQLVGGVATSTALTPDSSISSLASYFTICRMPPVTVGDYHYTLFQQIATYNGIGNNRQFFLGRMPADGTGPFVYYDYYSGARLQVATGSATWGTYIGLCHDGDNFLMCFKGNDESAPRILTGTYETQVLKLPNDLVTSPTGLGSYITDVNPTITSLGGTAIASGGNSPPMAIAYASGYYLLYPRSGNTSEQSNVGGARPGYGAYLIKGAVGGWALVNATATLEDDALGRCCPHIEHDGKIYLLSAHQNGPGVNMLKVWDPATDPAVVTNIAQLAGTREFMPAAGPSYIGARGLSWRDKIYFAWRDGSSDIGMGSYDPATGTFTDEITRVAFGTPAAVSIHLVPLETGLALVVDGTSGATGTLRVHYSTDETLTSWVSATVTDVNVEIDDIATIPTIL